MQRPPFEPSSRRCKRHKPPEKLLTPVKLRQRSVAVTIESLETQSAFNKGGLGNINAALGMGIKVKG